MSSRKIGKVKNIKYNSETKNMELTLIITDNKFKKKLLRDLDLSGKLNISKDIITYNANNESKRDG